ncbi:threonylcarbamoyl-AMP synthase [Thermaurantimonas aggregans]|uniref:Threonylcarbamoyl-AMP synthase n=1 Tax=Thermaurantimonas aggregans TaxID=2173829 RepID=A0A401XKN5_9FLAO|nr:L-threonylcarbamoyladenylate synthase [Thermaurantimonas aggregans]MCX8147881.1 L-threonylcarbamoyladenylate synthase [Thermaurantimonas aggregans]GCD77544.1 threonylcarbamoyl-AMP synthase [Thermaurantimonas aggregans]
MAKLLRIHPDNPQPRLISEVVQALQEGAVIIYPTDTVYSFGCDLRKQKAIEHIARLKSIKPEKADFSIIFDDLSRLSEFTRSVDNPTYKLLRRALPGPYTFILDASNAIPRYFKHNKKTVGIRIPDHTIPRTLVRELDFPIIASSVHDEEDDIQEYFTDPELIYERYKNEVDYVIDGGIGQLYASTVIDLTGGQPEVLREGIGPLDIL